MNKYALLIFAKNLVYGEVKTRLATTVGNDIAFSVYGQLMEHTASITGGLPMAKILFYSSFIDNCDMWKSDLYEKQVQAGNDLGERMKNAFLQVFNQGYHKAVIIGTDCHELSSQHITIALENLDTHDIVIGPAKDGGYYLLGMKTLYPQLFDNISWSTDKVLEQTISTCERLKVSVASLTELSDLDVEMDLNSANGLIRFKV